MPAPLSPQLLSRSSQGGQELDACNLGVWLKGVGVLGPSFPTKETHPPDTSPQEGKLGYSELPAPNSTAHQGRCWKLAGRTWRTCLPSGLGKRRVEIALPQSGPPTCLGSSWEASPGAQSGNGGQGRSHQPQGEGTWRGQQTRGLRGKLRTGKPFQKNR